MSRVSVELQALTDTRFGRLALELGLPGGRDQALGMMVRVWMECTLRETEVLEPNDIAVAFNNPDAGASVNAMVAAKLGEVVLDGVRVRGAAGRTRWLSELRAGKSAGGKARAKSAKRDGSGKFVPADIQQGVQQTSSSAEPAPVQRSQRYYYYSCSSSTPYSPPEGDQQKKAGAGSRKSKKQQVLERHRDEAMKLWRVQDELRRQVGWKLNRRLGTLSPNDERLGRVAERLERTSYDECVRVLKRAAWEAERSGDPQWFNGVTPWRPENFDRLAGKPDPEDEPRPESETLYPDVSELDGR